MHLYTAHNAMYTISGFGSALIGFKKPCILHKSCSILPARGADTNLRRVQDAEQQLTARHRMLMFQISMNAKIVFQRSMRASLNLVRVQIATRGLRSARVFFAGVRAELRDNWRSAFCRKTEFYLFHKKLTLNFLKLSSSVCTLHELPRSARVV